MNTDYKVVCIPGRKHAYEHRLVWERHFGAIPAGHHVHHKNGDKKDNRLENLELLKASEHHSHHFAELAKTDEHKNRAAFHLLAAWAEMPVLKLRCIVCDSEFEKRQHTKHGAAKYCSRKCSNRDYYARATKPKLQIEKLQKGQ